MFDVRIGFYVGAEICGFVVYFSCWIDQVLLLIKEVLVYIETMALLQWIMEMVKSVFLFIFYFLFPSKIQQTTNYNNFLYMKKKQKKQNVKATYNQ